MKKFITKEGEQAIRNFQYKGGSIAYSYQYLWSPFAEYCLKFIPLNWAPNTITLLGTILHIIGNIFLITQTRGQKVQPWTLLVFGALVFIYYTMDNIDGKQARRTKNSSPLGMCMDHGCDALGVSFIALGVGAVLCMGDFSVLILYSGLIAVMGSFWLSTWAQYHSKGILLLGKVNVVDDGIPFVAFMGIFTYLVGQDFWIEEMFPGFRRSFMIVALVWIGGVAQTFNFVFNSQQNFTKDIKGALFHLVHFVPMIVSLTMIVLLTDWEQQYFYAIYYCTVLPIVRDTSYMHVCVVAEQKYDQFQFATVFYSAVFPIFIVLKMILGFSIIPDYVFIYGVLGVILINYLQYAVSISNEMADILKIRIFHIKNQKQA